MVSSNSSSTMTILAEDVVDEGLTLILARGTGAPRLGIYNTILDKKKYIHLSWVESESRNLRVKTGRVSGKDYSMESIHASIHRLIASVRGNLSIRGLIWKGVQILGDLVHMPRAARNESECTLVPDGKKDTLWYSYKMGALPWRVRPSFIETERERQILDKYCTQIEPWRSVPLEGETLPATLRQERFVRELLNADQQRWNALLFPIAKAAVLGFSEWSPESGHLFGDALWSLSPNANPRSADGLAEMQKSASYLLSRLITYLRLYPVLGSVSLRYVDDVSKILEPEGYKKKERFEVEIASRNFKITRLGGEGGKNGYAVIPSQSLPGEKDRLIEISEEHLDLVVEACSLGGQKDTFYAAAALIQAIEVQKWLDKLLPFVAL